MNFFQSVTPLSVTIIIHAFELYATFFLHFAQISIFLNFKLVYRLPNIYCASSSHPRIMNIYIIYIYIYAPDRVFLSCVSRKLGDY